MRRTVCTGFRNSIYLSFSLLLFFLVSCHPLFTHPLPPPRELRADNQILGTWTRTVKEDGHESREQLSIFPRNSGWIDAMYIYDIRGGPGDGINFLVFEGYSTTVNKERFLCLRFREKDIHWPELMGYRPSDKAVGEPALLKLWFIVNYETSNSDELILKQFSTGKVEELIKEGKLKGQVQTEGLFPHTRFDGQSAEDLLREKGLSLKGVVVTSSAEELTDVLSQEGVAALTGQGMYDVLVFSRGVAHQQAD